MLRLCFFCFFDACAGFVHLVVWFFVFFDACAGFVTLTFSKHAQASKKTKKTKHDLQKTCAGIKKNKKQQNFAIYRPPVLSRCSDFVFFDVCAGFVHLVLCFFWFFDACAGFVSLTLTKDAQAWKKQNFGQALIWFISSTEVTIATNLTWMKCIIDTFFESNTN